ncbi:hypothetical protein LINPERPRIM_LOCUS234, partial [Linum perenne]
VSRLDFQRVGNCSQARLVRSKPSGRLPSKCWSQPSTR